MATIKIETFGCSANQADSESMIFELKKAGYKITKDKDFELIILNTCTVKNPTENKIMRRLNELKQAKKKVIVAGCIPEAEPNYIKTKLKDFSIVSVFDINKISEAVAKTLAGERIVFNSGSAKDKTNLNRERKNPLIEIIPISEGCLGNCAYCKTKQARKNLYSFPAECIVNQAEQAVNSGAKELWITSQDTGCYGFDSGTNLPELINKIVEIKGDFKIRIGMMNPDHVIKILNELIEIYKHPKVFKFLHIPIQSGNNQILKSMIRNYTVEKFKEIIQEFKKEIPNITISTDIILGFPGETEDSFKDTVNLVQWLKPRVLNISRYWERPGTISAKMENKVHTRETKEMSREILPIFNKIALEKNKIEIGNKYGILVDEIGKKGSFIGRNDFYRPIVIKSEENLLGQRLKVKITDATSQYLIGNLN